MSKTFRLDIVGVALLFASSVILGSTLFVPQRTHAQTVDELQTQLKSLMEQMRSVQSQLQQLQGTGSSTPGIPGEGWNKEKPGCPLIMRVLRRGSNGDDVSKLQAFLSEQGKLPVGSVTGLFGPATEKALKEWQSAQGIVSNGSASTTGWGMVGAKTREAIQKRCGNPDTRMPQGNAWGMGSGPPAEWRPDRASSTMPMPNNGMRPPKPPFDSASGTIPMKPRMLLNPASGTPPLPHGEHPMPPMHNTETSSIDAQTQANLASALTALEDIMRDVIRRYSE